MHQIPLVVLIAVCSGGKLQAYVSLSACLFHHVAAAEEAVLIPTRLHRLIRIPSLHPLLNPHLLLNLHLLRHVYNQPTLDASHLYDTARSSKKLQDAFAVQMIFPINGDWVPLMRMRPMPILNSPKDQTSCRVTA